MATSRASSCRNGCAMPNLHVLGRAGTPVPAVWYSHIGPQGIAVPTWASRLGSSGVGMERVTKKERRERAELRNGNQSCSHVKTQRRQEKSAEGSIGFGLRFGNVRCSSIYSLSVRRWSATSLPQLSVDALFVIPRIKRSVHGEN